MSAGPPLLDWTPLATVCDTVLNVTGAEQLIVPSKAPLFPLASGAEQLTCTAPTGTDEHAPGPPRFAEVARTVKLHGTALDFESMLIANVAVPIGFTVPADIDVNVIVGGDTVNVVLPG